jgi:hypothetical protein
VRESKSLGVYVQGLKEAEVHGESEAAQLMAEGLSHRTSGRTGMNERSSRSHSIFTMKITQCEDVGEGRQSTVFARMNLVDLAGSERASRTKAVGARLKEGANINKSLAALGNVISALASKSAQQQGGGGGGGRRKPVFVPYRDSKLTRVLQESLGGGAACCMLATISPTGLSIPETLSTLKYADRAKQIAVHAKRNEETTELDKLRAEVQMLRTQLLEAQRQEERGGGGEGGGGEGRGKKGTDQDVEARINDLMIRLEGNVNDNNELKGKLRRTVSEKEKLVTLATEFEKQQDQHKQQQHQLATEFERQRLSILRDHEDALAEERDLREREQLRDRRRRLARLADGGDAAQVLADLNEAARREMQAAKDERSALERFWKAAGIDLQQPAGSPGGEKDGGDGAGEERKEGEGGEEGEEEDEYKSTVEADQRRRHAEVGILLTELGSLVQAASGWTRQVQAARATVEQVRSIYIIVSVATQHSHCNVYVFTLKPPET